MQGAPARQPVLTAVPDRPRRRGSDRRTLRRVAAGLCLLLASYCLIAAAVGLAQTPAEPDPQRPPELPRGRLPLLIPLIFLVFLVVTAAVTRRGRRPAAGPPGPSPQSAPRERRRR
jgi:hypothetical protein